MGNWSKLLFNREVLVTRTREREIDSVYVRLSDNPGELAYMQMTGGDVQLIRDVDETEYLEYSERQTKSRTGAEIRNKIRSVKPKAFATQDGPDERNLVFVYRIYCEKRPNLMATTEARFYLSINYSKDSGRCWFKGRAMEANKLNSLMRTVANKAGLDEKRRLTNHNARKTMV